MRAQEAPRVKSTTPVSGPFPPVSLPLLFANMVPLARIWNFNAWASGETFQSEMLHINPCLQLYRLPWYSMNHQVFSLSGNTNTTVEYSRLASMCHEKSPVGTKELAKIACCDLKDLKNHLSSTSVSKKEQRATSALETLSHVLDNGFGMFFIFIRFNIRCCFQASPQC